LKISLNYSAINLQSLANCLQFAVNAAEKSKILIIPLTFRHQIIDLDMVKLANNTFFQLGVLMSSAMVGQTIGLNQSTQALELNNPLIQQLANVEKNQANKTNFAQSSPNSALFPQSFNLIAFSLPPKSVDSPINSDNFKLVAPLSQSEQTSSTPNNNQSLYLANAQSLSKATPLVYQVKEGDTITKIASRYQIPSHELIEFNQLQDSNIIFVDQRLQIPLTATKNNTVNSLNGSHNGAIAKSNPEINRSKSSKSTVANSPQSKSTKANVIQSEDSTPTEDPYIANLRAEIEQLREQNALQEVAQNTPKQQPQVIGNDDDTASLVSVTKQQTKQQPLQRERSNSWGASATSSTTNLINESSLALKLPPLPSSQAYLPDIFDGYTWPAEGVLTSGYGWRWGRMHEGIDIAAPIGTPVLAAASGVVIGAGWHEGYGNLIKLEHLDGSFTLYGHNSRNLVTHGQQVKQGEQIAEMGSTGRSTGSHLHFEIHLRNEQIVDPLTLLTSR
jgi:murein DD-endopeptidase MepM/ murein hydrolase activator NlpD